MKDKEKEYLEKVYFNPKNAGSFSGPDKLYRFVKKEGKFHISKKDIIKWIQSQEVYTTNRLVKRKITRRKVIAPYIDYMWDSDTASLNDYAKENDGKGYFVIVIDIMSRFIWTQAIKTPSKEEVKKVFQNIFKTGRIPEKIRTDKGTEFCNQVIRQLFKSFNISHFVTQNEVKANYAERAIQTIKGKIMRYLRYKRTRRWVDVLPEITLAYNNSYHRSIKRSPSSVSKKDENELWEVLYGSKKKALKKKIDFKFKLGDIVRISKLRKPFQRYYSEHWTNEFFFIAKRKMKENIPIYELKDYLDEPITGTFYEEELQKIFVDENTEYFIEKVLAKRTRNKRKESLVRWVGWPKKFDSWIPSNTIADYK